MPVKAISCDGYGRPSHGAVFDADDMATALQAHRLSGTDMFKHKRKLNYLS
jgi:hypothetical protein